MVGTVYNIQRFSLADGPSIRTTVFLSGCTLRCQWCHNPEGLKSPTLQYLESKCVGCGACKSACAYETHYFDTSHCVNFNKCRLCGKCVSICPSNALKVVGKSYEPSELTNELLKDLDYYENGGGVTFSGGEPLMQADFVSEVAKLCKAKGIPTVAIDTAGNVPWANIEKALPYADIFLYDIKAISSDLHRQYTGCDNEWILNNLLRLTKQNKRIWIRIPIIGGFNATNNEIGKIADFVNVLENIERVTLIPFHTLGHEKYATVGMVSDMHKFHTVSDEQIEDFKKLFKILEE